MTYTAGTQGADANAASVFAATLNTLLVAAGFTAVETWTATTQTAIIYKSPAASNAFGSDWYLNVYRSNDTTSSVYFGVAEVWDTGTKKFRNYTPTISTMTPTGAFAVNDAVGVLPSGAAVIQNPMAVSTAGFQYWLSANPNRIVVANRVSSADTGIYAGLYDDLLPVAISPFPLGVLNLLGNGAGSSTREPGATTSTGNAFGLTLASTPITWGPTTAAAELYSGKYIPARLPVVSQRASTAYRGLLKDVLYCPIAAAVNGDTLAVTDSVGATRTYTRMSGTGVAIWADQGV